MLEFSLTLVSSDHMHERNLLNPTNIYFYIKICKDHFNKRAVAELLISA